MTVTIRPYRKTSAWEVDLRIEWPTGETLRERVKSPVTSKSGSQRWGEARERTLYLAGPFRAAEGLTLEAFWPDFEKKHIVAEGLKASSVSMYEFSWSRIKAVLGPIVMEKITQSEVQDFKASIAQKVKPSSVNHCLVLLNLMFKKAVEWKILSTIPFKVKLLKVAKSTSSYTSEEYECLIGAALKIRNEPGYRDSIPQGTHLAMLLLGGDAGFRAGEISGLTWPQIDFPNNRILINQASYERVIGSPKGTVGSVPMTRRLQEALKYLETRKTGSYVIQDKSGGIPTHHNLKAWMKRIEKMAGMPETGRMHILRHTYCSLLAQRGAPSNVIKEMARHSSLSMTERYMHLVPGALDRAVALLESPLESGEASEEEKAEFANLLEVEEEPE